jgi:flagellar biosynthesis/type III secretory pathway protein FliH
MNAHSRPSHVLFAEDFDLQSSITVLDPPDEPELIAPSFTTEAVETAREEAYAEGYSRGLSQAAQDRAEIARQLLASIAQRLADAETAACEAAEASAVAVAELLMNSLAALFPTLCARHGSGEVAALARIVLPALDREPRITLRVSPHVITDLDLELAQLDPDLRARITVIATDAAPPGDARITWQDGAAGRDGAVLWAQIAATLSDYGLAAPEIPTGECRG